MSIWDDCKSLISPQHLNGQLIRVVESQEQVATNGLVDNFEEQDLLEEMLEQTKPLRVPGTENIHWLLATPFRYPPLPHGSRFGSRFERSLFYGSLTLPTALAETGYYRLLFWRGMRTPPPGKLLTQHTVFAANYKTEQGAKLHEAPFNNYENLLTHRSNYLATQQLGAAMREANIHAFEFTSARAQNKGINIALFSAEALTSTRPVNPQLWLCETGAKQVSFYRNFHNKTYTFSLQNYLFKESFPEPAV
ncbi:MAG: RES family NAD+ phosphorylase [Gammaproteobacteria bacterium]|nr:RES family NAD+ phosphorylase [Gammaproteobacteria bacterium]